MKIGVLTWHKVVNHGAVLQAYATQSFLESNGYDVVMLDYVRDKTNMDNAIHKRLKRAINQLVSGDFSKRKRMVQFNLEKSVLFDKFRKDYLHQGKFYYEDDNIDVVVVGSDMVFDIYEGYNPFMYGQNVSAPAICAYSACFGYTTIELLDKSGKKGEISHLLGKMKSISYRDDNTFSMLREITPDNISCKTLDPVLLYGFDKELDAWDSGVWANREPYIVLYSYGMNMNTEKEREYIRSIASNLNCKIISLGYWRDWCDESVNASPEEFFEVMKHAKFVVTDTFHGTVFSVLLEKQFCSIVRRNAFKVVDLLNDLNATCALASMDDIDSCSTPQVIDYTGVRAIVSDLRNKSSEYLLGCAKC